MAKNDKLIISLSLFTLIFTIIAFIFAYPFSTIYYVGTAITNPINQNNIHTQFRETKTPLISYLVSKPTIISTQSETNSPIVDIKYTVYKNTQIEFQGYANQQKVNVITVKFPYSAFGKPNGNVTVEIPSYTYHEALIIKDGRETTTK